jgi:hypothetical protein
LTTSPRSGAWGGRSGEHRQLSGVGSDLGEMAVVIPSADIARLQRHLLDTLSELHPDPARIEPDEELCRLVVGLYDYDDVDAIWSTVEPYLHEQRSGLRNVWREHGDDPSFALLDRPEALVVFERAEHASEQLRRIWPGPRSWLSRISDVWGVPL